LLCIQNETIIRISKIGVRFTSYETSRDCYVRTFQTNLII